MYLEQVALAAEGLSRTGEKVAKPDKRLKVA